MDYPARLTYQRGTGGYAVYFRDIPEAFAFGDTAREALRRAPCALAAALTFYFESRRPVPSPSEPNDKEELVTLPLEAVAKVLLHNEMVLQNVNTTQLARIMNASKRVRKINFTNSVDIDLTAKALSALGKHLEIVIRSPV